MPGGEKPLARELKQAVSGGENLLTRELKEAVLWLMEERLHGLARDEDADLLTRILDPINDLMAAIAHDAFDLVREAMEKFAAAYQEVGTQLEVAALTRRANRQDLVERGQELVSVLRSLIQEGNRRA